MGHDPLELPITVVFIRQGHLLAPMVDCTTGDLVVLHLEHYGSMPDEGPVPHEFSIPGIGEALDVGVDAMAERIELLSALSTLKGQGLVVERTRQVEGLDGERNVYTPTAEGIEHARELRASVADSRIRVENGTAREVDIDDLDRHLAEPALVRALARLTDDGVLYLDEGVEEAFVDREAELAALQADLDAVADGEGRGVLVAGEAGVGKTTLVDELLSAAADRDFRVLEGVCRRDTSEPYRPFREALAPHLPDERLDALFEGGPAAEDPESFAAQRAAMFAEVGDAVDELAAETPLVVFVDDLHTADEPTMAMFEALAGDLDEAPVLLAGAYRPEDLPDEHPLAWVSDDWADREDRDVLELEPFDRGDTRRLIELVVDTRNVPESFVDLVHRNTGGNPLFVTESTKRMLDRGTVEPEYGVYPDDEGTIPIPDRVEAAIDIRLEVLDGRAERVLSLGSLIGETIPTAVLAAASDLEKPELREYVDLLVDSHVWEWADDERLRFASGLIRETVVARTPEARRRHLHERIAAAMAEVYEDPREHAAAAAHHYRHAGADRRALEHYRAAAEHARDVYAHEAAVENYERALEVARELDDDDAIIEILEEIGRVNRVIGEFGAANRFFGFVRERTEDTEILQRVARLQSRMAALQGDYDRAIEHADRGLALSEDLDAPETCRLLDHKGWALMQQAEFDAAERVLDRATEMAERLGDPELEALSLHNRASVEMSRGTADDETVELFEEAAEIRERIDDRRGLAETCNNLGAVYMTRNRMDDARESLERCLEINEEIGNRSGVLSALNNLGRIHQRDENYDRAIDSYRRALEEARRIGARQTVANALGNLGQIHYYERNDPETAIDRLERSLTIQRDIDNKRWQTAINRDLAEVYADQDELSVARERAQRALEIATETGMAAQRAVALRLLGDIEHERGNTDAATDRLETALSVGTEIGAADSKAVVRDSLVDPYLEAGRVEDAGEQLDRLRAILDDHRDELTDRQVEALPIAADAAEGKVLRARGEYDRAAAAFEAALEGARETDLDWFRAQMLYERGRLERERGDHETAREYLDRARARASDAGSKLIDRKCRELIDEIEAEA